MKKLSTEEKAKRYDDAINRANKVFNCKATDREPGTSICEYIFPEIKESEDDRIRKEIMNHLQYFAKYYNESVPNVYKWLHWIEKQGEKHLENYDEAEKEKSDFVGDGFIKCSANFLDFKEGETYWLEYIGDDMYNVRSDNLLGKTYHITPCQLYTVFKKLTWIEKKGDDNPSIESKFHEGDLVVTTYGKVNKVINVDEDGDGFTLDDGTYFNGSWKDMYHLFTVEDAKKGWTYGDWLPHYCNKCSKHKNKKL